MCKDSGCVLYGYCKMVKLLSSIHDVTSFYFKLEIKRFTTVLLSYTCLSLLLEGNVSTI